MLTQAGLKEALHYDADSGIFRWKISKNNRVKLFQAAGHLDFYGYIKIRFQGKLYFAHRLAWLYVNGKWPTNQIDHINGVRNDNRICNLRCATVSQNLQNLRNARSDNKSGFLGVGLHKRSNKYYAHIRIGGKLKHLGSFKTAEQAHAVYLAAKREQHEFCTI